MWQWILLFPLLTVDTRPQLCENIKTFLNSNMLPLSAQNREDEHKEEKCQIWNHMITDTSYSGGATISEPLSCVIAVLSLLLAWQMTADMSDNCVCVRLIWFFTHTDHLPDHLTLSCCYCAYGIINTWFFMSAILYVSSKQFVCNPFFHYLNHQRAARCQTLSYYNSDMCVFCVFVLVCVKGDNLSAFACMTDKYLYVSNDSCVCVCVCVCGGWKAQHR